MNQQKQPKVSVIIPIYNVEKYLPRCLDSVINQTLKDIEIICVNDESPDNCAQILQEYQAKDERITVINQQNSGQGSARNRGLETAKGKYIQFLDSDDFYEPNCCEEMYNLMEQNPDLDVACFDTNIIYEAYEDKKNTDDNYFKMHFFGKVPVKPSMAHQKVDVNCWNKIFRKSFIDKHNLRFPEKLHYEDVGFFWLWITRTGQVYFSHQKLTNYVRRQGSFLGEIYEKSSKTIFDAFKVHELIYQDLQKNNKWDAYKNAYVQAYLLKIRWLINCFKTENWQDRRKLIDHCAQFLASLDLTDANLSAQDEIYLQHVLKKNYFRFQAFNNYELEDVQPVYQQNSVNLVFSTDEKYCAFLGVTIQSVIDNASKTNNYDIVILERNLQSFQKRFLLSMAAGRDNISIRFINMAQFVKKYELDKLFTVNHISYAAYFRLFLGQIFASYKRVLYLDCDLIATRDVAELFHADLGDNPIGAVVDPLISNLIPTPGLNKGAWDYFKKYMDESLSFTDVKKYFNSGVMVIDIERFNKISLDYLLHLAKENHEFFHDQNVLNAAFEGKVTLLPETWNFAWSLKFSAKTYQDFLEPEVIQLYEDPDALPAIIHYTSHVKPWNNFFQPYANFWWEYARKTPFYEIILKYTGIQQQGAVRTAVKNAPRAFETEDYVRDVVRFPVTYLAYMRCKLLKHFCRGDKKASMQNRQKQLHTSIQRARAWWKGR